MGVMLDVGCWIMGVKCLNHAIKCFTKNLLTAH